VSDNREQDAFIMGICVATAICTFLAISFMQSEFSISGGKDFIMGNATYKCSKTNELKERGE